MSSLLCYHNFMTTVDARHWLNSTESPSPYCYITRHRAKFLCNIQSLGNPLSDLLKGINMKYRPRKCSAPLEEPLSPAWQPLQGLVVGLRRPLCCSRPVLHTGTE